MRASKRCCIVISGEGYIDVANYQGAVSAYSFIQAYGLLTKAHLEVCVASPGARLPKFQCEDDEEQTWLEQHNKQLNIIDLALVNAAEWDALCLPSCLGGMLDLASSEPLGALVQAFAAAQKPVCAVGFGVLGLGRAVAHPHLQWSFQGFNCTGCSNMELARLPYFSKLPAVPEEMIHELGGVFAASLPDAVMVVVDRFLITAQNAQSTTLAILNLVWLLNSA